MKSSGPWLFFVEWFLMTDGLSYLSLQVYSYILFLLELVLVVCVFLGICSFYLWYLTCLLRIFHSTLLQIFFFISVKSVIIFPLKFLILVIWYFSVFWKYCSQTFLSFVALFKELTFVSVDFLSRFSLLFYLPYNIYYVLFLALHLACSYFFSPL